MSFRKLESKANAEYNFDIRLNGELQPTTSRVKLHFGRGADHVVNRNYVYVTSKMRHDVKNIYNVILAVVATAEIPSKASTLHTYIYIYIDLK